MTRSLLLVAALVACRNSDEGQLRPIPIPSSDASPSQGKIGVRELRSLGVCNARACVPPDLCCNACGHVGWQTAADGGSVSLEARARDHRTPELPTCRVDGCGKCHFTLEARGYQEDQVFVVLEWKRKLEERLLEAYSACTRRACPPAAPCCNACSFSGWGAGAAYEVRAEAGTLPTCTVVDGCGRCPFRLRATGYQDGQSFLVGSWREETAPLVDREPLLGADRKVALAAPQPPGLEPAGAGRCSRDDECAVVTYAQCTTTGCSPPCGVYASGMAAVRITDANAFQKRAAQAAQKECQGVMCTLCIAPGIAESKRPWGADPSRYRATCKGGTCTLVATHPP